ISSLSETAVSTLTNSISKEFHSFGSLTWIAGGYLMTIVAFTPLFGKFSDIFGRKPVGIFAISLFFIGSLGCALSTSIDMLIAFRVVSGIGGGGLSSLSFIMVSDVIPVAKRPQFLAGISLVFCLSQVLGPILGGIVADHSWRIIFYSLLPLCILLAGLIIFVLELPESSGNISHKLKRIDYLGSLTLILSIVVLILMTTLGGKDYSWTSTPLIILYILEILFLSLFILVQWKFAKEPILPSRVFNRNIICANIANFCCGAINLTTVFYLPVYYLTVKNLSPSQAGYQLIPLLISNSLFCLFSAYFARWFKTIRGVMWIGGIILVIGVILLCFVRIGAGEGENISYAVILGIGLGMNLQLLMLISQISVDQEDAAISTSFNMFTTYIGGVIGVAITGSVYNNIFVEQL
ncbi:MFS general substrate transporter, partial [Conidiobolus coronatus NRRL 28638]